MSRVYVVHQVRESIGVAQSWGELRYVNHRYIYGDEIEAGGALPTWFVENMQKAVDDFDPANDHLLIVGDHLQLMAMAALLGTEYGKFRVLRYDRKAEGYLSVTIDVNGGVK